MSKKKLFRRRKLFSLNVKGESGKKNRRERNQTVTAKQVSENMCRHFFFQKYVELVKLYHTGIEDLNPQAMGQLAGL